MKIELTKISVKSFIIIFTSINVISGFVLGSVVSLVALVAPDEQGVGGVGGWAILVFPILNGLLGVATGALITSMYNLLAKHLGGVVMEYEDAADK